MRQLIHQALTGNVELNALIHQRHFQGSALGVGDVPESPEFPWLAYSELPSSPYFAVKETSRAKARTFQFFVYDERGSFLRIELILGLVRETLLSLVAQVSPSGARCTDVEWQGESSEISDPDFNSNLKIGTARFTVSQ